MSLQIRKLVKKISSTFKEERSVPTRYRKPLPFPSPDFRWKQRALTKEETSSYKLQTQWEQLEALLYLEDLIDKTNEDEIPIKWDCKQYDMIKTTPF